MDINNSHDDGRMCEFRQKSSNKVFSKFHARRRTKDWQTHRAGCMKSNLLTGNLIHWKNNNTRCDSFNQQTKTSWPWAASLHKHLKHYHKYFVPSYILGQRARPVLFFSHANRKYGRHAQTLSLHQHDAAGFAPMIMERPIWAHSTLPRGGGSAEAWNHVWRGSDAPAGWLRQGSDGVHVFYCVLPLKPDPTLRRKIRQGSLWLLAWLICFDSCAMTPGISRCSCK